MQQTCACDADDTRRTGSIAQRVTAQIIHALRNGTRPWVAPWDTATALGLPLRANGAAYRGGNIIALWAAAQAHGYRSRHWLSFRQAREFGGAVRRGERGQSIIYYGESARANPADSSANDTHGPPIPRRAVLRSYTVFCADQIAGLPLHFYAPAITPPTESDTALAERLARVPANMQHGGARACYNLATDTIHLPPRHSFTSAAQFYATWLHELGHWSGALTRLDRDFRPRAARSAYAFEELVAELTAAFLGAELGLPIDHIEDHASYLDHWLKIIDRDPGALLVAASKAQAAADYLRAFLFAKEPADAA